MYLYVINIIKHIIYDLTQKNNMSIDNNSMISAIIKDVYLNEELNSLYLRFKWTPSMIEWKKIKEDFSKEFWQTTIVLFQMWKFYETYFHDAYVFSKVLNITLTKKNKSDINSSPMSGVNIDFISPKIEKLAMLWFHIIVVSELETKGENWQFIRDVDKIITPWTFLSDNESRWTNVICSVDFDNSNKITTLSMFDIYTSSLKRFICNISDETIILSILSEYQPKEFILNYKNECNIDIVNDWYIKMPKYEANTYSKPMIWNGGDYKNDNEFILNYAVRIFKNIELLKYVKIETINTINQNYNSENEYVNSMILDSVTIENLEILKTTNGDTSFSLLWFLNKTITSIGNRTMKNIVLHPLKNLDKILDRQLAIKFFQKIPTTKKNEILSLLLSIYDIERIASKISNWTILPSELNLLKESLANILQLKKNIINLWFSESKLINEILKNIDNVEFLELISSIENSFLENPSNLIKEGGLFKYKYNENLDYFINLTTRKSEFLSEYENKISTEIKWNVKIIENTQGIFIEINSKQLNTQKLEIPKNWYRMRWTKVYDRFSTDELIDYHKESIYAKTKRNDLEYSLFTNFRLKTSLYIDKIQKAANSIGLFDVLFSIARLSTEKDYNYPTLNNSNNIIIINWSHPIVESLKYNWTYVKNNIILSDKSFKLLTWPNMWWKSVYLKSIGIITLMAHLWMPVPASHSEISLVDNIFIRAGASDNFVKGQSTFFLEMYELSNIIKKATKKSLVLLDEVWRWTDTSDWEALALSASEYFIQNNIKTVFATHYHWIIEKIVEYSNAGNTYVEVINKDNELTFTHKIIEWNPPIKNSYWIEIARMAWLPNDIIKRAFFLKKNS